MAWAILLQLHNKDEAFIRRILGGVALSSPAVEAIPKTSASHWVREDGRLDAFDKAYWGKGVLNVRNALVYAPIMEERPDLSPHARRTLMLEKINAEEQEAALRIQQFRARKHKLMEAEIAARPRLTVDADKPGRKFEEAEGNPPPPSVADESDAAYLARRGVALPETKAGRQSTLQVRSVKNSAATRTDGGDESSAVSKAFVSTALNPADLPAEAPEEIRTLATLIKDDPNRHFYSIFDARIKPLIESQTPAEVAVALYHIYAPWLLTKLNTPRRISSYSESYNFTISQGASILELIAEGFQNANRAGRWQLFQKFSARECMMELVNRVLGGHPDPLNEEEKTSILAALYMADFGWTEGGLNEYPSEFLGSLIKEKRIIGIGAAVPDRVSEEGHIQFERKSILSLFGWGKSDKVLGILLSLSPHFDSAIQSELSLPQGMMILRGPIQTLYFSYNQQPGSAEESYEARGKRILETMLTEARARSNESLNQLSKFLKRFDSDGRMARELLEKHAVLEMSTGDWDGEKMKPNEKYFLLESLINVLSARE